MVALDAGHGGHNRGCLGFDGVTAEKDVALTLADEIKAAITSRLPHAEIIMTRQQDASMTLAERVAVANAASADLFLSVHANASVGHDQAGFETFVLDARASSQEAAWTARRENDAAELSPGSLERETEARTMVRQLELTAQRQAAMRFAAALQRHQALRFPERPDRGVRQAPFDVLLGARMPAVLFEAAFLDHPRDGQVLLEAASRQRIAEGVAEAVAEYYRLHTRMLGGLTLARPAQGRATPPG